MAKAETPAQTIARQAKWIADLQSGMFINCVYCGHRYGPRGKTPVTMADMLKEHIAGCPQHPMHAVLKALKAGRDLISSSLAHVSHSGPSRKEAEAWLMVTDSVILMAESPTKPAKKKRGKP